MADRSCNLRLLLDCLMIMTVGIPVLLFKVVGVPYQRGFFCDDESIRLPFKNSTVTSVTLYFVGFFTPLIVMAVVEAFHYKQGRVLPSATCYTLLGRKVNPLVFTYYCRLFMFGFGCCCSQFATDVGKYSVGRLRPHFIDVCDPNWETIDCGVGQTPKYIDTFTCSGDPALVKEARLSFPSGHASFSAYTMVFLVLYLQAKLDCQKVPLLKPVLQLVALMMAMYTGLSRISDHKHNWSDVLFGSLLGSTVAVLIVFFVCDNFKSQRGNDTCSTILPLHPDPMRRDEE